MIRGFKKTFWGFLVANISLSLGIIPILPSFAGWLIVLDALADLEEELPEWDLRFVIRRMIVLLVFSFIELVQWFGTDLTAVSQFFQFLPIVVLLIELSAFHKLLETTVRHYGRMNRVEKRDKLIAKDKWYLLLMGGSSISLTLSITLNYLPVFLIGIALSLAARGYLLYILYSLSKEDFKLKIEKSVTA